jgi:branched-chain amino acid transport system substrate-binding protein
MHMFRLKCRKLHGKAGLALALSLATVATGVGAATTASASVRATSKGPIVIGGIYAGFNFPGAAAGFQAGIERFNKAGGIEGRKIQFVGVQDDQDTPTAEMTAAQQLVESKHVFAIAPVADDVAGPALMQFLGEHSTPVIGYGVSEAWCEQKWAISIVGCQQSLEGWENTASIRQIIRASKKPASQLRVAMEGYNLGASVQVSDTLAEVWRALGADVVFNQDTIPLAGAPSQAPYVQAILASNPNVVFEVTGSAAAISLAAALKTANYKGIIYNGSSYDPVALASQPSVASALNGVYTTNLLPTQYDGSPAIKQELKDLKSVGAAPQIEIGTDIGYWSAQALIGLLEATKARGAALTPTNVAETTQKGVTIKSPLAGGNGPLTWPFLSDRAEPCNATVQGAGKTYFLSQKFTCYNDIKVKAASAS